MPDLNHSQFKHLFHGTDADLQPGDVVTPRSKKVAHATPHVYTARSFGSSVYEVAPVHDETWATRMKYTGSEYHTEVLSEHGFQVVDRLPKSRRDSFYTDKDRTGGRDPYSVIDTRNKRW